MNCKYETNCYMRMRHPGECFHQETSCSYAKHLQEQTREKLDIATKEQGISKLETIEIEGE